MKQQINLFKMWFLDLPKQLDLIDIDFLLVDQSDPVGACVAEYKNIPFITVCMGMNLDWEHSIPPFFLDWEYGEGKSIIKRNEIGFKNFEKDFKPLFDYVNKKRNEFNISPYNHSTNLYPVSPIAQIAQIPEFLDYPRKEKSNIFYNVGPFIEKTSNVLKVDFDYEKLNGKPLVYISLGTILNMRADIFELIGQSFHDINVQLVISTGNRLSNLRLELLPKDTIVCDYVPQRDILSKASLCITHGGLNTVMDALSNGVPLLVIPISFDQPGTAARVKYRGVGLFIRYSMLSKELINSSIKQIMNDKTYYNEAKEMQEKFSKLEGTNTAIEIIEKNIQKYVR